jgi:UDP-glucuronate 4-epimerase
MARYLVTGAAGFIASRTCSLLLEAGHEIIGIDNLNDYYDVRLKSLRLDSLKNTPGFTFKQMDIESLTDLQAVFAEHSFDGILNLAARAGVRYSLVNPHVYFTTNAAGTLNLLECARANGVKQFVLASTSSLYAGQSMPFVETLPVNTPISPYAASKKAAEVTAFTYHSLFDINVAVVRYFTVYGPAGRPDMSIFRFIRWVDCGEPIQMNGSGNQSRDFTYVDDIARGTVAALGIKGYEVINLGGGNNPISMNAIISMAKKLPYKTTLSTKLTWKALTLT